MLKNILLLFTHIIFLILLVANAMTMGQKAFSNDTSLFIFILLNIIFCYLTYLIYRKYFSKIYLTIIYVSCSMFFLYPWLFGYDFKGAFVLEFMPYMLGCNLLLFIYLMINTNRKNKLLNLAR